MILSPTFELGKQLRWWGAGAACAKLEAHCQALHKPCLYMPGISARGEKGRESEVHGHPPLHKVFEVAWATENPISAPSSSKKYRK